MNTFDVIVIGSGPGGYVCAIRCAQLGMKTAVIEKYNSLGGTCMNVGCIPSKALLDSSEHYYLAKKSFSEHGINIHELSVDLGKMIERKNTIISRMGAGINFLMTKNKITVYHAHASFEDKNTLSLLDKNGKQSTVKGKHIIIATGSKPTTLPFLPMDKKRIITSTEALNLKEIPKHLLLVGGGVIGLELGSVFSRLGAKVSVVEFMPRITPTMDTDISKELQRNLKKQGLVFYLEHKVTGAKVKNKKKVVLTMENKKGQPTELIGDYCLVAVGRKPYTEGLNLEKIGVRTEGKSGMISINDTFETSCSGVYAIGDVVRGPMLAHKAHEEGVFVAELLDGQKPHIDYLCVPNVIYTEPEVAAVGYTEQELKEKSIPYKKGSYPYKALGRAAASNQTDGFTKVLAHKDTDQILGVHMIGARVSDQIAGAAQAMEFKAAAEDIGRICHPHPTFVEAFKEACLNASENRAINI